MLGSIQLEGGTRGTNIFVKASKMKSVISAMQIGFNLNVGEFFIRPLILL